MFKCGEKKRAVVLPEVAEPLGDVPWYSGVMPCADTCLSVEKVHLALLRGPLLCRKTQKQDKLMHGLENDVNQIKI